MTWFRCGGSGIPAALKSQMNDVLNKKFGTSIDYPPNGWPDNVNLLGPLPEKTASGSVASITDGADGVPLKNWGVTVDATLSGVSSVVCTQTGKNLLPNKTYQRNATTLRIGTDTLDGTLKFQAGTYTLSVKTALTGATLNYTSSGSTTSISTSTDGDYRKGTFTLSEETELFFGCYNSGGITSAQVSKLQLEVGNSRTAYNAYNSTTHIVSLGRTIYGGNVDVVTGEGTDGYGKLILSDLDGWVRKSNQNPNGTVFAIDAEMTGYSWDTANSICNYLTPCPADKQNFDTAPADTFWFSTNGYLRVCTGLPNTGTTKEQFLQWAENNGVFIVSPLSTTTDFTFTPITPTPETALGVNNFWADEGDSTVVYRRDIDLALQAVSGTRNLLMMASRPVAQMVGEESDPDQVNELVEDNETEQEDENDAR